MGAAARGIAGDPGGNLWNHGLPGTGDADRPEDGRLQPGRRGFAAPRDGQEDPRGDGTAARDLHQGRHGARHTGRESHRGLRPDGKIRRLRLQQVARRRLCPGRLSDRVDEGEPPGRVHRRLHEPGDQQHRQARGSETGSRARGHQDPAAGHQPLRGGFHGRTHGGRQARHPLCAGGGEEGRPVRDGSAGRRARRSGLCRHRRFCRTNRS